jgi:hypothetical protein
MAKKLAQDKTTADLEKATWFKDAFSGLDLDKNKGIKQPAPPPKALFNLDGKWLIKTIHERHMHWTTTTTGSPPLKKGTRELVDMADLDDEDSASSSDDDPASWLTPSLPSAPSTQEAQNRRFMNNWVFPST